jgi:hypothetical protein
MDEQQDRNEQQEEQPEAATTERNAAEVELDNAAGVTEGEQEGIAEPAAELEAPALEAAPADAEEGEAD